MSFQQTSYLYAGQLPPLQHTQFSLPPWHQQHQQHPQLHILLQQPQQSQHHQQALYHTQATQPPPPHLAQHLITYGSGVLAKSEPISPQTPSSTSKSPAPVKGATTPPLPPMQKAQTQLSQSSQQKDEEIFYLAVLKSERTHPEVKSLLGETSPVKDKANKTDGKDKAFIPSPASNVKQELGTSNVETVVTEDAYKTVVPIDPSLVPEGKGMADG